MENIVRKREIARNKQFLLFSQCLLPYMALIFHFECTLKYCLQFVSFWTSVKFNCMEIGYAFWFGQSDGVLLANSIRIVVLVFRTLVGQY